MFRADPFNPHFERRRNFNLIQPNANVCRHPVNSFSNDVQQKAATLRGGFCERLTTNN